MVILDRIRNWLSNRKQCTDINGKASEWSQAPSGVMLGSVLGPLFFLTLTNNIDMAVKYIDKIINFADDTKMGHNANTDEN